ncbi:MAG: hypothetical protein DSM107014_02530 [Gomphosphaeria aponina SAG 52.96 = DSM 107014]|uniref:Uncharacterized protein n=1 Tax=Gomphosphaeria aponina SAG 52.96 = DSM 107014 TaxID=1521640 RepID=A0A941GTP3_9CHRO|nr:hypothetical protein [Gomphosphaeria aponina SAG 52.96 = DSM 107014]
MSNFSISTDSSNTNETSIDVDIDSGCENGMASFSQSSTGWGFASDTQIECNEEEDDGDDDGGDDDGGE